MSNIKIELKNREGQTLFLGEAKSLKEFLVSKIKEGADLRGADLRGADLRGADLRGADLKGAYLEDADLRGADLKGAYLKGADLECADLRGADLRGADLRGADLKGAYLKGAYLRGADLLIERFYDTQFNQYTQLISCKTKKYTQIKCGYFTGSVKEFKKSVRKKERTDSRRLRYERIISFIEASLEQFNNQD